MNWTAISAVADLLASIGVIVSLIYLASQLKFNSKYVSAANYQQMMGQVADSAELISSDAQLADIYRRGLQSYDALEENEKIRFHMAMTILILPLQSNKILKDRDLVDDYLYGGQLESFLNLFRSPGIRQWWREASMWFHADFVDYLNGLVDVKDSQSTASSR